ncbi:right-handed parallel beta-helix repeat-containing protein [Streptomyces sp. NPDC004673]
MNRRTALKATGSALGGLLGAQVLTAQAAEAAPNGPIVDVRDCGAVGNGTTDDTNAFRQAFAVGNGATVLIPPGVYPLSASMVVKAGTTVSAYGARIVRNSAQCGALLRNFDAATNAPGYSGAGRITVRGGTWDMNGATYTGQADAIGFSHAQDVLVQDCALVNIPSAHALELNAVRRARIVDCVFDGLNTAVDTDKEAIQITAATSAANLPAQPYDNTPCSDIQVTGCTLRATTAAGYGPFGALCGDHGGAAGALHTDIRVIGNHIEAATGYGVKVTDWRRAVIADNTIDSAGNTGIYVRSLAGNAMGDLTIEGNTITRTGSPAAGGGGIVVSGAVDSPVTGLVITGNVVTATQGQTGIYVGYAPQALVNGNSVPGTRRNTANDNNQAIQLQHSPNSLVTNNVVSDVAGDGIAVDSGSDGTLISGNRITTCANHGLAVGGNDMVLRDNVITGANGDNVAATYAIRIGGNAQNASVQGNVVRKTAGLPAATAAIGVMPGTTGAWITGNDLRGWGSAAVSDSGSGTLLTTGNPS